MRGADAKVLSGRMKAGTKNGELWRCFQLHTEASSCHHTKHWCDGKSSQCYQILRAHAIRATFFSSPSLRYSANIQLRTVSFPNANRKYTSDDIKFQKLCLLSQLQTSIRNYCISQLHLTKKKVEKKKVLATT